LRIARLLAQAPGATFVARSHANVRWLTGLAGEPHTLYGMAPLWAVVGPAGALRVLAPAGELAWIEEQGRLDGDVIAHGAFVVRGRPSARLSAAATTRRTRERALELALEAVGAGEAVIADDEHPAPFLAARAVKDAGELAALRRVNELTEAAVQAALALAAPGMTERELLRALRGVLLDGGARPMLGSVGFGERGALVDHPTSDRPLGRGEAIRLDVGATLDGYHSDLARTAVLGPPPDWLADAHAALLAGEDAALAAARPGATAAGLFGAAVAATRAAGLPDYDRTHCGHGIGLDMYEPPSLASGDGGTLAPGMTLCVETPLYELGRAGVQIEDAIAITADGCERLGRLARELIVL
jgi:Xaa-Pro aminopeptidase